MKQEQSWAPAGVCCAGRAAVSSRTAALLSAWDGRSTGVTSVPQHTQTPEEVEGITDLRLLNAAI